MYAKMPEIPSPSMVSSIALIRWLMFCGVIFCFFVVEFVYVFDACYVDDVFSVLVDYCRVCFLVVHWFSFAGVLRKLIGERFVRFASAMSSFILNELSVGVCSLRLNVVAAMPVCLDASAMV